MSDTLPLKPEITDPETVRAATRRFKPSGSSEDVAERSIPTPSNGSNLKPPIIIGSPSLLHQRPIDGLETIISVNMSTLCEIHERTPTTISASCRMLLTMVSAGSRRC